MMRKLKVWCVLGMVSACSPSDESSLNGVRDGIESGDDEAQVVVDGGIRKDASAFPQKPGPAPSCDIDGKEFAPSCDAPVYVPKCMPDEVREKLALDVCGDEFVGSTVIPADADECDYGTDAAWVVCCYGDKGPTIKDAGVMEPGPKCIDMGVGSDQCSSQEDLAIKLSVMCKEQGLTLFPFVMDKVGDCAQGYGYHLSGQCCTYWDPMKDPGLPSPGEPKDAGIDTQGCFEMNMSGASCHSAMEFAQAFSESCSIKGDYSLVKFAPDDYSACENETWYTATGVCCPAVTRKPTF